MSLIRSKQVLNREIKEIIWNDPDDDTKFPKTIFYCGGMGEPTFKITIDKIDDDTFIDQNGQKWVKCN